MTYQQNSLIQAADFNNIVGTNGNVLPTTAQLNSVWGIGTRDYGYGQVPLSTVDANATISHTNWNSLITTLQAIVSHQGGVFPASLVAPVANDQIKYLSALQTTVASINKNRLSALAQGTTSSISTRYTTAKWKDSLIFNHTITFESADKARYFFNAGGQIAINFTHSATSTKQDLLWNGIASSCGTIYISGVPNNETATIAATTFTGITKVGGSGTSSFNKNLGFFNLTTGEQLLFTQYPTTAGLAYYYLQSFIKVYAKVSGNLGTYGGVGSILNIKTVWDQDPNTLLVEPGNNTGPVNNSTTTVTVRYPTTINGLQNTWGNVTVAGTVIGN